MLNQRAPTVNANGDVVGGERTVQEDKGGVSLAAAVISEETDTWMTSATTARAQGCGIGGRRLPPAQRALEWRIPRQRVQGGDQNNTYVISKMNTLVYSRQLPFPLSYPLPLPRLLPGSTLSGS